MSFVSDFAYNRCEVGVFQKRENAGKGLFCILRCQAGLGWRWTAPEQRAVLGYTWHEVCASGQGWRQSPNAEREEVLATWKFRKLFWLQMAMKIRAALLTWKRSVQVLPHGLELRSGPTPDPALSKRRDGHAEKPMEGGFWGTSIHFHRLPLKAPCYFFLESFSGVS